MKVMEAIKVGLLLELGSNETQPGKPSIKRYESLICNMQEIPSKKRKTKRIEILQNLYNLSRPYPHEHSSSASKERR